MPKISVVIPAYNAEKTIRKTIDSVLSQSFEDLEIIVINDGSTDNTIGEIESFSDPRVRLLNFQNGGLSTARNRGIEFSRGQYIAFIDADDLWTPEKLEKQLLAIEKSDRFGASYSWTYHMYDGKEKKLDKADKVYFSGEIYEDLLNYNFLGSGSNPLVRKSAIDDVGMFDPRLKVAEDWDFYLRLALRWEFALVQEYQIIYRKSNSTMSSNSAIFEEKMLQAIEIIYENVPDSIQIKKSDSLAYLYLYLAEKSLDFPRELSQLKTSLKYLIKATRLKPEFIFKEVRLWQHAKRVIKFLFKIIFSGAESFFNINPT